LEVTPKLALGGWTECQTGAAGDTWRHAIFSLPPSSDLTFNNACNVLKIQQVLNTQRSDTA
jgi:hypothetical protein